MLFVLPRIASQSQKHHTSYRLTDGIAVLIYFLPWLYRYGYRYRTPYGYISYIYICISILWSFSPQDMVLTDTDALAARRDLADRLKQREYQMAVDADMEAERCWKTTFLYRFMMVYGRELGNCRPYVSICIHYDIPSVRLIMIYHHLLHLIAIYHGSSPFIYEPLISHNLVDYLDVHTGW